MNDEKYYFSAKELSFYPESLKEDYIKAGSWPNDLIEVEVGVFLEFTAQPPQGKVRGSNKNGMPAWKSSPASTKEELISIANAKKEAERTIADKSILPLQDAVDLEMATDEELSNLNDWKKYRVLLNRIDTSTAPEINWPQRPLEPS